MLKSLGFAIVASTIVMGPVAAEPSHGIAMRGAPALPADYTHFPYANPDAPKGGTLTYGVYGTFDDLNPFDLQRYPHGRPRPVGPGFWVTWYLKRCSNVPGTNHLPNMGCWQKRSSCLMIENGLNSTCTPRQSSPME